MKKLFALFMVVAMLSVAGAAVAASPSISASETSVILTAGKTSSVAVSVEAGHGGRMSAITATGPAWATVSGNTLTLAPASTVAAGNYTVMLSATETFSASDVAGHSTLMTETAVKPIAVTVMAAGTTGKQVIVRVVERVKVVVQKVTVISSVARKSAVVQTFAEVTRSVTETITTTVLTKVEGYTTALAQLWAAKAQAVETARAAFVNAVVSSTTRRAQVFPGLPATAVVTPRLNSLLKPATSSTTSTNAAEKLAAATSALGGAGKALSAGDAVQPEESGIYSFPKTFGKNLYGTPIKGNKGMRGAKASSAFVASAADDTGVVFVNSSGDIVTKIPGDENSENIMPGYVNMLVVMEAGEVYEPVVYATEEDLKAAGVSVDTTPTEVSVNEVEYKKEEVVVQVSETGDVEGETVVEEADAAVETAMKAVMGDNLKKVPATSYGALVSESALLKDDTLAETESLHIAARPGWVVTSLPDGVYYMAVSFDELLLGVQIPAGATFIFYPDGISVGTEAALTVFDETGAEVKTPSAILGKSGYIAFEIINAAIKTADTDNTLDNPTVAVKVEAVTPTPTTSPDVVAEKYAQAGYISSKDYTILETGFAQKVTFSSTVTTGTVKLNFPVDPTSWRVVVRGYETEPIKASAIGTITGATSKDATITLVPSEIAEGLRAVTLYVRPVDGTSRARQDVSASLGAVTGTQKGSYVGVGSSSGGCSAGSAVLAMAVLGAFIATRKK